MRASLFRSITNFYLIGKSYNISGTKATAGPQGAGFRKSAAQPKGDNRPYLQYILFATLLGADSNKFYIHGDKAGFDLKVYVYLF